LFPDLYHAHHSLHMEDLNFWLDLASSQGGPILELGCGTGRVLVPLARHGYRVYGLDRDAAMLSYLHSHVADEQRQLIHVWQADLAQFRLSQSFPLILLPCNTLSTLNAQERNATLHCVYRHLAPGGIFAASIPNPRLLSRMPTSSEEELEEIHPSPQGGEPLRVSSAWKRTASAFILTWIYEWQSEVGQNQRLEITIRQSLAPPYEYMKALSSAGLAVIDTFGDFDRSPYTPDSANWIVVARKPSDPASD
jgi:SAM-dependent methyltransferase